MGFFTFINSQVSDFFYPIIRDVSDIINIAAHLFLIVIVILRSYYNIDREGYMKNILLPVRKKLYLTLIFL
jgi:hypothetical protein